MSIDESDSIVCHCDLSIDTAVKMRTGVFYALYTIYVLYRSHETSILIQS